MKRIVLLLFLVSSSLLIISEVGSSHSGSEAKAFVNGEWFTGKDFQSATFYTVNGILTKRKPNGLLEIVDLQGGFVVPAFADAHNHLFEARLGRRKSRLLGRWDLLCAQRRRKCGTG